MGLGGCQEIGTSCYAYKAGEEVVLIDMGTTLENDPFPRFDLLPVSWRNKLTAIILTHLHADHALGLLHHDHLNESLVLKGYRGISPFIVPISQLVSPGMFC